VDEGRRMRLIIGKKPLPELRDNNGKTIKKAMFFNPDFPDWLLCNRVLGLKTLDQIPKLNITRHQEDKQHRSNPNQSVHIVKSVFWYKGKRNKDGKEIKLSVYDYLDEKILRGITIK